MYTLTINNSDKFKFSCESFNERITKSSYVINLMVVGTLEDVDSLVDIEKVESINIVDDETSEVILNTSKYTILSDCSRNYNSNRAEYMGPNNTINITISSNRK